MGNSFIDSLKQGIGKVKENPQLLFSVVVAGAIVFAFVYVANSFVTIAEDAQDRLMNIRNGFLLESFVEFAPSRLESEEGREELQSVIYNIVGDNPSFNEFKIVQYVEGVPTVILSSSKDAVGTTDTENEFLYDIARIDSNEAYTVELFDEGERSFSTARSLVDSEGNEVAVVLIDQSLTEADLKISEEINRSIIIFIVIVILIMFLFFRHARIIDYTVLYKKLKGIDQLKDDFISMASHELRSPLTVIRGYAEELVESGKLDDDLKVSAERIDISARQLDGLVNDMLDVSRIEQGRMKLETKRMSPIDVISDVVSGFKVVGEKKGLEVSFRHSLTGELINIDENKFRQVMTNIIGNAVKYTPGGSVKVNAEVKEGKIEFRVSDTGIGMTADEVKNLFKKFYRVKNSETAEIRGTGLGLWITKQIVELMGGTISVESIKGVGTHFVVRFDVVE